jgi:hypothetical protein
MPNGSAGEAGLAVHLSQGQRDGGDMARQVQAAWGAGNKASVAGFYDEWVTPLFTPGSAMAGDGGGQSFCMEKAS